ncbi:MAG TPA: YdcF family protein [Actinomycetota bacterium]|nr:YdcF family protein [Actinomycetota bacterium]
MGVIRRHPIASAVGLVAAVALAVIAFSAITVWRAAHHDGARDADSADAIVVLGAAQYDGEPSPVFRGRLDHALLLWQQGRADMVITVGSKQPGDRTTEAEAGRTYLVSSGVPLDATVALPVGRTTFESLEAAAGYLEERGRDSAFLVSDPWHNARVTAMADDLGLEGHASATWTSGARSEDTRGQGYVRETFAYLFYLVAGD